MLQSIEHFQGAYVANIEGVRGAMLQFENQTPIAIRRSKPDRGMAEDGRVFVPEYAIPEVMAALAEQAIVLANLEGKDVLGQAVDELNRIDRK